MTKNFPALRPGDVMVNATGREYAVAHDDGNNITYAYVPVHGSRVEVETRTPQELEWVERIRRGSANIWTRTPKFTVGETVNYNGEPWVVKRYNDWDNSLLLNRSIRVGADKVS